MIQTNVDAVPDDTVKNLIHLPLRLVELFCKTNVVSSAMCLPVCVHVRVRVWMLACVCVDMDHQLPPSVLSLKVAEAMSTGWRP